MKKPSPLVVPKVEEYLEKYKEEIAHEFGIFYSSDQAAKSGSIHHIIKKILKQKEQKKKEKDNKSGKDL